jgi:hypothetical protein
MSIPLSALIKIIGIAVQKANQAIEESAANIYLEQGYEINRESVNDSEAAICTPISYTLHLPSSAGTPRKISVPVTALLHNTSLQLESVEVKLKFMIEEAEDEIAVTVKPEGDAGSAFSYSELSLQFKNTPSAEGMARITQRHLQSL